ncbi:hypothetical protein DBV39_14490 [Orrella marina]|uniref:YopA central domain-containing protein n=2 Tax=Orrella marina TaxID=2163011 RepID=A0A2R4XLQ9_9BURK|nr:hypothetical protein DBV39_14490 [Orrella marina]
MPAYDFSSAPETVVLMRGQAEIGLDNEKFAGTADLLLRFQPRQRLIFNAKSQASTRAAFHFLFPDQFRTSLSFNGHEIEGFYGPFKSNSGSGIIELDWHPKSEPVMLSDMQSKTSVSAILHLFNFPEFRGGQHQAAAPSGCQILVLESDEWRISIQSLPNHATYQAWERIRNEDGCFLTHVAKVERKDRALFSGDDAREVSFLLSNFLSFIKGSRYWTVCEVGFDQTGNRTWETFASPHIGKPPYSWFNPHQGSQAEILFPLFATRWQQSEEWMKCLRSAIYWYLQANTSGGSLGIDSAIILAQAAFERLAYQHLVVDKKMISPEGLNRLKASDQLRLLFSSLDIPVSIGDATPSIKGSASQLKWEDAPHALTEIRNELVHPVSKKRIRACIFDAWKLSLWYLELSVLALCGYDDTYTNRLTAKYVGESEKVPWSKST